MDLGRIGHAIARVRVTAGPDPHRDGALQRREGALIGGVVYRGNKIKGICGRYFWGMHSNGAVRSMIVMNGQKVGGNVDHPTLSVPGSIASFGEDSEGEIWMSSKTGNAIFRIEAGP